MKFLNYIKIILINFFLLYFLLYALEIFINYKNGKLFKKTRLYYLNKDSKKNSNQKIYLNFGSYKLIDKNNDILPLSGYEKNKILLCLNEKNEPIYFYSDKNGFNNENLSGNENILLIGDSYVQGMCVQNKDNLNAQFKKFNLDTSSLGVGGNGPLLEFATYKEFNSDYQFNKLILFLTIDNDYYDLSNEKKNKILMNYLNKENFKQNLSNLQNKKKKIEILDNYFGDKTERLWNDFLSVYHFNLKQVGNLIEDLIKGKNLNNDNYLYLQDNEIDKLFIKIIENFNKSATQNKIEFFIVFNSITPDILYAKSLNQKKFQKLINKKISDIKSYLEIHEIRYFDYSDYLTKNYNEDNISLIFKKINNKWDHYTEKGFSILTKEIVNLMN
tara:strand:- start:1248 stop:2408 length:1161 start_codon:yes stop_codon:yes gene_type:complete